MTRVPRQRQPKISLRILESIGNHEQALQDARGLDGLRALSWRAWTKYQLEHQAAALVVAEFLCTLTPSRARLEAEARLQAIDALVYFLSIASTQPRFVHWMRAPLR